MADLMVEWIQCNSHPWDETPNLEVMLLLAAPMVRKSQFQELVWTCLRSVSGIFEEYVCIFMPCIFQTEIMGYLESCK